MPLLDEKGERIRGNENKEAARVSLARIKLADELRTPTPPTFDKWTVAKVCAAYLADLYRTANPERAKQVDKWLNDLCGYCGALDVHEFQKKHLRSWLQRHTTWNHNSQRNVIGSVKAAFNFCCAFDDLDVNPVAGYQKPAATPRVASFSLDEEQAMYEAADEAFGLFPALGAVQTRVMAAHPPYNRGHWNTSNLQRRRMQSPDHSMDDTAISAVDAAIAWPQNSGRSSAVGTCGEFFK